MHKTSTRLDHIRHCLMPLAIANIYKMAWARCFPRNRKANSYIHRRLLRLLNAQCYTRTCSYAFENSSPWSPFPPEGSRVSSVRLDLHGRRWRSGWCGSSGTHASCRTTRAPGASKAARCAGRTDGYSEEEKTK